MFEDYFEAALGDQSLMGVFRGQGVDRTLALCSAAWDAGLRNVEVTIGAPDDIPALAAAVAAGRERGLDVGAGTVLTLDQLDAASRAGAAYTVAPGLDRAVVAESAARGLPHLPGVATPTEVQAAVGLGLTWLKAFPITWLGPSWVRHIRGPFPGVRLVGTGGVTVDVAEEYLAAGVRVLGLGSGFDDPASVERIRALAPRKTEG